ncbi:uncharacterized protein LOC123308426 isoform X2 [Coccinella septempunctata]|nr:uncharacterized protein LOC123308426 isoform X2 [Coccinella septempunctata]
MEGRKDYNLRSTKKDVEGTVEGAQGLSPTPILLQSTELPNNEEQAANRCSENRANNHGAISKRIAECPQTTTPTTERYRSTRRTLNVEHPEKRYDADPTNFSFDENAHSDDFRFKPRQKKVNIFQNEIVYNTKSLNELITKVVSETINLTLQNVKGDLAKNIDANDNQHSSSGIDNVSLKKKIHYNLDYNFFENENSKQDALTNKNRGLKNIHSRVDIDHSDIGNRLGDRSSGVQAANIQSVPENNNENYLSPNSYIPSRHSDANAFVNNFSNLRLNERLISLGDLVGLLPNFDGEGYVQAPNFLQILENGIDLNTVPFSNVKIVLGKSFRGSAKLWWEAYSNYFNSYVQFKNEFLGHFWDRKKQLKVKEKLENSEYISGSFTDHFNYWVGAAKFLQPPYSPAELIDLIAPHFPPNVASSLLGCNSFSDAVSRLRQADRYYKNESTNVRNSSKTAHSEDKKDSSEGARSSRFTSNISNKYSGKNYNVKTVSALDTEIEDQGNGDTPHH